MRVPFRSAVKLVRVAPGLVRTFELNIDKSERWLPANNLGGPAHGHAMPAQRVNNPGSGAHLNRRRTEDSKIQPWRRDSFEILCVAKKPNTFSIGVGTHCSRSSVCRLLIVVVTRPMKARWHHHMPNSYLISSAVSPIASHQMAEPANRIPSYGESNACRLRPVAYPVLLDTKVVRLRYFHREGAVIAFEPNGPCRIRIDLFAGNRRYVSRWYGRYKSGNHPESN